MSIINDTAGGVFTDLSGSNQYNFGSGAATLTAGQGTDTVSAGNGSLVVDATGDANPISIQGGAGALVYAGGTGAATIAGGAGAVTILPANGAVTFVSGGQPVNVYASSSYNGYYEFAPPASDTLSLSFNGANSQINVFDQATGKTLVIDQGFAFFSTDATTDYTLVDPPATITGFTPATQATDALTSADPNPVLTGTAPPRSTITLTDAAGNVVGTSVLADSQGFWQIALPTLPYGQTDLTATASNIAGGAPLYGEPPVAAVVHVLPPAPAVAGFTDGTGAHAGSGSTFSLHPEIDGTTGAGTTVTLFLNGAPLGAATVTGTAWAYTPVSTLPEGHLTFTAVASDPASGLGSAPSSPLALDVQLAAPTAAGFTDATGFVAGGATLDHRPVVSGTAQDGTTVAISDNGALIGSILTVGGAWSFTPAADLADGLHAITAVATDPATGAVSAASAPLTVTINPSAPVLTSLADSSGPHISGDTVSGPLTISGTTDAGTIVTVSDGALPLGAATVSGSGWTFALPAGLTFGPHSLTATTTDPSDSVTSAISTAFVFTLAPPAPTVASPTLATNNNDPTITGTAVTGDFVTVYDGATSIGSAVADGGGNWQVTPAIALAYGTHALTATDTAANGAATSQSSAADTIDVVPPASVITALDGAGTRQPLSGAVTADVNPTLSGTGTIGLTVAIYDGATLVAQSGAVAADGTWSVRVPAALSSGLHILTAQTTDATGAPSGPSATLSLVVNPAPAAAQGGADPFAAAIRTAAAALLGGNGDNAVVYAQPGQPTVPAGAGQVQGLSIDDSMAGQSINTSAEFVSDISSGPVTIVGSGGGGQVAASTGGNLTYVAGPGSAALLADQSSGDNIVFGSTAASSNLVAATGAGNDIFVARNSDVSLSGGAGANQFWLGSGQSAVDSNGVDTLIAGAGAVTVTGGGDAIAAGDGHSDLVFAGSGRLDFSNALGGSTVAAGSGSSTLIGGQGPSLFFGGATGGNILVSGAGPSTMVGGGNGDLLYATGSGNDVLAAGGDNATLSGGASTGDNIYFGGSGHNVIAAGNGNDTIGGGSGQSTIFAGAGNDLIFGAAGGGDIVASSGNATLLGGAGPELYGFASGSAGGDVTIYNFRAGTDHVTFQGYTPDAIRTSLLTQVDQSGSAQVQLTDGTRITFIGLHSLQAGSIV